MTTSRPSRIKSSPTKQVYMAGPLFTLAEWRFNADLKALLSSKCSAYEFILPQERASQFLPDLQKVVADCFEQVKCTHIVIACLDGPDGDSGTCLEVGYAIGLGKRVIGYRTDFRATGEVDGVNAMLRHGCSDFIVASAVKFDLNELATKLAELIELSS